MLKTRRLNRTGFAGGRVACVLRGHFDVLSPTQATYSSSRPSLSTSGRASDMHQLKPGLDRFCFVSELGECRARAVIRKIGYHHSRNLVAAANAAWQAGRLAGRLSPNTVLIVSRPAECHLASFDSAGRPCGRPSLCLVNQPGSRSGPSRRHRPGRRRARG